MREGSPNGKSFLSVSVGEKASDFRRQRFDVGFKDQTVSEGGAGKSQAEDAVAARNNAPTGATMVNFQVTWFDFPLTDNTLLSTGARFAFFIDRVCKKIPPRKRRMPSGWGYSGFLAITIRRGSARRITGSSGRNLDLSCRAQNK